MEQGRVGPMGITVELLKQAFEAESRKRERIFFLLDGKLWSACLAILR